MWGDKETTAPIPSVAPDGEQPFALTRNDSIPFTEEKNKSSGGMTVIPMPKLMEIRFPVKPAVIEGLLPVGTYLLAGAPKVGKSFFVLQMAYRVSTGGTFLDCPVHPGTVLYLALEDTLDRLQKRLVQMTEQDSPDLILSVLADTLDENLLAQLEGFLMDYPDTVLVIIDTLQRVRGRTPDSCSYAADYDTLAKLKTFADAHGITLVLVHHTRKESAEDVFHTISGTNGLMGAADGALILHKDRRTGADAVFSPRKKNSLMIIVMWPRQPVTFFAGLLRYRVRRKKQHSKLLQHYKSGSQIQHGSLCIPQRFYMLTVQKYLSRKRGQIIQKCQTNIMLG